MRQCSAMSPERRGLTALRSRRHADLHRVPVRGKHVVSVVEDAGDDRKRSISSLFSVVTRRCLTYVAISAKLPRARRPPRGSPRPATPAPSRKGGHRTIRQQTTERPRTQAAASGMPARYEGGITPGSSATQLGSRIASTNSKTPATNPVASATPSLRSSPSQRRPTIRRMIRRARRSPERVCGNVPRAQGALTCARSDPVNLRTACGKVQGDVPALSECSCDRDAIRRSLRSDLPVRFKPSRARRRDRHRGRDVRAGLAKRRPHGSRTRRSTMAVRYREQRDPPPSPCRETPAPCVRRHARRMCSIQAGRRTGRPSGTAHALVNADGSGQQRTAQERPARRSVVARRAADRHRAVRQ